MLYHKRIFKSASTNEKLTGISELSAKETILKEFDVSLIICCGKYCFSPNTFEHILCV